MNTQERNAILELEGIEVRRRSNRIIADARAFLAHWRLVRSTHWHREAPHAPRTPSAMGFADLAAWERRDKHPPTILAPC
ncbi:MAG: hypothetical protein JWN53_107 [Gemmatimonadetes bacterium]|jgi:hypothetical protein|nr:hypothetical protein [Frankiales bacterium]MDB4898299.1 hypothetical protein [Gemmatimonadota bacterium]